MKRPAILCAVAAVVALFACGSSNNANGSFPFSGPSCPPSSELTNCFGCYEQNCNGSCLTSACGDFFSCICACNPSDQSCLQGCFPKAETPECSQCAAKIDQASCQQACGSQCGGSVSSSGGIGSSSSGGSGGSGSGGQGCTTSNGPCPISFCSTQVNGTCSSAYYEVGTQIFPCASCSDTQVCLQEATNSCLDAGPVADSGPVADVGPGPDVGLPDVVFDAPAGATCTAHACGTMGQSFEYCELDDGEGGACTQAWYQLGTQVFACTSCSAAGCQAAEQAALMACP
jgi:hypothetical protein